MMNNQVQLNDLTIYDQSIPQELSRKLDCMKILYMTFLIFNIILIGMESISALAMLNAFSIIF